MLLVLLKDFIRVQCICMCCISDEDRRASLEMPNIPRGHSQLGGSSSRLSSRSSSSSALDTGDEAECLLVPTGRTLAAAVSATASEADSWTAGLVQQQQQQARAAAASKGKGRRGNQNQPKEDSRPSKPVSPPRTQRFDALADLLDALGLRSALDSLARPHPHSEPRWAPLSYIDVSTRLSLCRSEAVGVLLKLRNPGTTPVHTRRL